MLRPNSLAMSCALFFSSCAEPDGSSPAPRDAGARDEPVESDPWLPPIVGGTLLVAGDGSAMTGKRPFDQLKVPASTTTPPMLVPWPPMNLVAECTTMSAPHSIGRQAYGVAVVASTTRGMPCAEAMAARASRSATTPEGLATTSVKSSLVRSVMAASKAFGWSAATKLVCTPRRRRVTSNWVTVPP